jgi:hypothetical protein
MFSSNQIGLMYEENQFTNRAEFFGGEGSKCSPVFNGGIKGETKE